MSLLSKLNKQTVKWKNTWTCLLLSGSINKTEVMYPMPKIVLVVDDVRRALGKMKKGKQPGWLDQINHLTEAYNAVLEDGTVLEK